MNEALAAKLKYLHLGQLLAHWDDYLKLAGDQRFSHARLLTHVVEEQYRVKREQSRQLRLRKAHVPEPWVIETFPFDRQPKLNAKKIMALYDSLSFMTQSQNIVWLGGTGVGKTGLATSFLIHAINQGYSGRYVLFGELLAEFYRSCADHSEAKLLSKYLSYDCLLIDEIGVTTRKCQNCPVRENQTWTILGLEREIAPIERVKDTAGGIEHVKDR